MAEFEHLLDKYQTEGWRLWSQRFTASDWGDIRAARLFLERYWLASIDFPDWQRRAEDIFGPSVLSAADPTFRSDLVLRPMLGVVVLIERDWEALRRVGKAAGDSCIVLIGQAGSAEPDDPEIRLRFPIDATWADLMSGNFVSSIVFEMPYKEYLVLGDSARWGMFSASEHEFPFNVIGSIADLEPIVRREFEIPPEEAARVRGWLPPRYVSSLAD
jgi:hypothetical protein